MMSFLSFGLDSHKFKMYMTTINQIHRTIRLTYELSETELTFLDKTNSYVCAHIKPTKLTLLDITLIQRQKNWQ